MKKYKVTLKITSDDSSISIEHSDIFLAKSEEEAKKMAVNNAKKDLILKCDVKVLKIKLYGY